MLGNGKEIYIKIINEKSLDTLNYQESEKNQNIELSERDISIINYPEPKTARSDILPPL